MPTVLLLLGWRVFFYANEGSEPIHVHCRKGDMECKFWLDVTAYDIQECYAFNLSPKDRRQIRKIVFDHFDLIVEQWQQLQQERGHGDLSSR